MSTEFPSAGQPGVPRCSGVATGQVAELKEQLLHLCNDLWDVHALLRATQQQLTDFELHGKGETELGGDAADTLRRLLSLTMDTVYQLAESGKARETHR